MRYQLACAGLFIALFIFPGNGTAQPAYPQGYFRNPLGIPILLAGNFGECRPGHFHSGIDIKTAGRENLPVYAAADGYISRIKMEPGGFGHGLYITHPNGYTTLYAHLSNFVPAVQQYVRRHQYAAESWTVDLTLPPGRFPVRRGDQIAYSGNTGGSTAPHLHFEIRNTQTEHPLNPQLFGLAITDTRPPLPTRLAVYDRSWSIYEAAPDLYPLKGKGGVYTPARDTLPVYDQTGFGLEVNDYMNGSGNTLAFYTAAWYVDDVLQGRIRLDDIGYDETRYLHAYADYKTRQTAHLWIQCLFRLPGNALTRIYEDLNGDLGHIVMPDGDVHKAEIRLADAAGNESVVGFYIKRGKEPGTARCREPWTAAGTNTVAQTNIQYTLDPLMLYDDACSAADGEGEHDGQLYSDRYTVGSPYMPAHHYFDLALRPNKAVPFSLRSKLAVVYSDGTGNVGRAAIPQEKGWYRASVRGFGRYWLAADTAAPVIRPLAPWQEDQRLAKRIAFRVTDAGTAIQSFRGELDGAWILFEQHEDTWFYDMDSHCPRGPHTLTLTATDENGNTARKDLSFTR